MALTTITLDDGVEHNKKVFVFGVLLSTRNIVRKAQSMKATIIKSLVKFLLIAAAVALIALYLSYLGIQKFG